MQTIQTKVYTQTASSSQNSSSWDVAQEVRLCLPWRWRPPDVEPDSKSDLCQKHGDFIWIQGKIWNESCTGEWTVWFRTMSKGGVEVLSRTSLIPPALCIPAADERRAWHQAQFGGWRDELAKTSKVSSHVHHPCVAWCCNLPGWGCSTPRGRCVSASVWS